MEFKDRLRLLRKEYNLSYAEMATDFEKTEAAIRAWEMGRTSPNSETLIKLANYFKCTTDYLLGLSSSRSPSKIDEFKSELLQIDKELAMLDIQLTNYETEIKVTAQKREETSKRMIALKHRQAQLIDGIKTIENIK